jgi:hypothetical protein
MVSPLVPFYYPLPFCCVSGSGSPCSSMSIAPLPSPFGMCCCYASVTPMHYKGREASGLGWPGLALQHVVGVVDCWVLHAD